MKRPGLTPIAIQKGSMFYVTWTSLDPWVRAIVKAHKLTAVRLKFSLSTDCLFHDPSILKLEALQFEVNSQGATQITFQKFGIAYGFNLAMFLAQWVEQRHVGQPVPDPSDESQFEAAQGMIRRAKFMNE